MLLGLGITLQVSFVPLQEAGCDVARAHAAAAHHQPGRYQMLPRI